MNAMDVAARGTGSSIAQMLPDADVAGAEDGEKRCFVIGVETKDTWPVIVNKLKILATTVAGVVTFLGTARSLRRSESSSASAVAKLATWLGTAIRPMSRSVTPAVALVTSKNFVNR